MINLDIEMVKWVNTEIKLKQSHLSWNKIKPQHEHQENPRVTDKFEAQAVRVDKDQSCVKLKKDLCKETVIPLAKGVQTQPCTSAINLL